MRLAYCKLGVIQAVTRILFDVLIHCQYLRRQSFHSRVKQRPELVLDALRNHNPECIQILCHGTDSRKFIAVRARDCDNAGFQTVIHHRDNILLTLRYRKQPYVKLLPAGNHLQGFQYLPIL